MYVYKMDLAAAGIPYLDAEGQQADFHALRHTFGTNMGASGIDPLYLKMLMRHSDIRQTMAYVHADQMPLNAAIEKLPGFSKVAHKRGPHDLGADCQNVALGGTTPPAAGEGGAAASK